MFAGKPAPTGESNFIGIEIAIGIEID